MKKAVLILLMICVVMVGRTQSFEGTLTWSMKTEIKDPKLKRQMEEAKKKANDPATQAKMKEMEAKMNDPQMKAMLESNPQMKAQMEAAIKAMSGGGMDAMMPTGIVAQIKGGNTLTTINGGMMDKSQVLHTADNNVTYSINNASKTYVALEKTDNRINNLDRIDKTSETQQILGYTCTKYIVKSVPRNTGAPQGAPKYDASSMRTTYYWTTNEIKGIDMAALAKQQMGREMSFIYSEIEGVPLKIELINDNAVITMECTDIKNESLPDSIFVLPSGYTETKIGSLYKN